MPNPFPGMNPYLEASWSDVHSSLVIYARDALQKVLPSSLRARVERRVVQRTDEEISILIPDVQVVERREDPYRSAEPGTTAVAEPLILDLETELRYEKYVEIRDVSSGNKAVSLDTAPGMKLLSFLATADREYCADDQVRNPER